MEDKKIAKIGLDEIAVMHSTEAMLVSIIARHFVGEPSEEDKKAGQEFLNKVIDLAKEQNLKPVLLGLVLLSLIGSLSDRWQKGVMGVGVTDRNTGEMIDFEPIGPDGSKMVN